MTDFSFFETDAGRSQAMAWERHDCTVRAVALLFGVDYATAHHALKIAGRRDRCRFSLSTRSDLVRINGKKLKKINCLRGPLSEWLAEGTAHYGEDYILGIAGHVFCVKNGVVHDSASSRVLIRPRKIAKFFYTLVDDDS